MAKSKISGKKSVKKSVKRSVRKSVKKSVKRVKTAPRSRKTSSVRRSRQQPWQRVPFSYQLTLGDRTTSVVQKALKSVGVRWSKKPVWIKGEGKYPGYFSGSLDMTGVTEGQYATLMRRLRDVGAEIGQAWKGQWH